MGPVVCVCVCLPVDIRLCIHLCQIYIFHIYVMLSMCVHKPACGRAPRSARPLGDFER